MLHQGSDESVKDSASLLDRMKFFDDDEEEQNTDLKSEKDDESVEIFVSLKDPSEEENLTKDQRIRNRRCAEKRKKRKNLVKLEDSISSISSLEVDLDTLDSDSCCLDEDPNAARFSALSSPRRSLDFIPDLPCSTERLTRRTVSYPSLSPNKLAKNQDESGHNRIQLLSPEQRESRWSSCSSAVRLQAKTFLNERGGKHSNESISDCRLIPPERCLMKKELFRFSSERGPRASNHPFATHLPRDTTPLSPRKSWTSSPRKDGARSVDDRRRGKRPSSS